MYAEERLARLRAFKAMEREENLFAARVDGWSPWRVIRFPVFQRVLDLSYQASPQPKFRRILTALPATLRLLVVLVTGRHRDLLIKTFRTALRLRDGNRYRDIYFDRLLDYGYSSLKIEGVNSAKFDAQAAAALRKPDLDAVVFTFWGRVLGTLFPGPADARKFCETVSSLVAQRYSVVVEPKWLLMRVSTAYWQARLYELLLRRVRPKAVLVADTGEYSLRIAAGRYRIPFVELQHGVFDTDHPDAVPLWVDGSANELLLPNVLACQGDFWIGRLAGSRQGQATAVAVGNPLVDLARSRRSQSPPSGKCHLVVTTQGLDTQRLVDWLRRMIAAAPPSLDWRMSIKLHPMFDADREAYAELGRGPRVAVIGGAELPATWDLLAEADLHLSISSACHFDAVSVGVPTIVIPLAAHEFMLTAVEAGHFMLACEPTMVWSMPAGAAANQKAMYYFAVPGFVNNLRDVLVDASVLPTGGKDSTHSNP
jgi:hypothetical protein